MVFIRYVRKRIDHWCTVEPGNSNPRVHPFSGKLGKASFPTGTVEPRVGISLSPLDTNAGFFLSCIVRLLPVLADFSCIGRRTCPVKACILPNSKQWTNLLDFGCFYLYTTQFAITDTALNYSMTNNIRGVGVDVIIEVHFNYIQTSNLNGSFLFECSNQSVLLSK